MGEDAMPVKGQDLESDDDNTLMQEPAVGDYYLFVIAVDAYVEAKTGFLPLNNPCNDAKKIVKTLINHYTFVEPEEDPESKIKVTLNQLPAPKTRILYNKNATYNNILGHFIALSKTLKEEDSLLVFFSGHGKMDRGDSYIVPYDRDKKNLITPKDIKIQEILTRLKFEDGQLSRILCRNLLLVMDCCHAGVAATGELKKLDGALSRRLLTSTFSKEVTDGLKDWGSPFARAFLKELNDNTADIYKINNVSLTERLEKEYEMIRRLGKSVTQQPLVYASIPDTTDQFGEFEFRQIKPRIEHLNESFMEHLNFDDQRPMRRAYKTENHFNLITSFGKDENEHRLLFKILLRLFSDRAAPKIKDYYLIQPPFRKEIKVELESASFVDQQNDAANPISESAKVWRLLWANIYEKPPKIPFTEQCQKIITHIFDNLKNDLTTEGVKNGIIRIQTVWTLPEAFQPVALFCEEFQELWIEKVEKNNDNFNVGKMFVIIACTSDSEHHDFDKSFEEAKTELETRLMAQSVNKFYNKKVESLDEGKIEEWLSYSQNKEYVIKAKAFQDLSLDVFKNQDNTFDYDIEDFIKKVCSLFDYEFDKVSAQIFDFHN